MTLSRPSTSTAPHQATVSLSGFVESFTEPALLIDPSSHRIACANNPAHKLFGRSPEKILECRCNDLFFMCEPVDCPFSQNARQVDYSRCQVLGAEGQICGHVDRTVRTVKIAGRPFFLHVLDPETGQDSKESEIRDKDLRWDALFENTSDACALFHPRPENQPGHHQFNFLLVNPAWERLTGRKASELVGKSLAQCTTHEDRFWLDTMEEVARTKLATRTTGFSAALGKWLTVRIFPVSGQYLGATFQDFTPLEEKERQIRSSEAFYRRVVEDQTDPVVRFSADLKISFANRTFANLFGWAPETLVGFPILSLASGTARDIVLQIPEKLSAQSPTFSTVFPDSYRGKTKWFQWNFFGFFDKDETLLEVQAVGRDVTNFRRNEEELKKQESEFRDLVEEGSALFLRMDREGTLTYANRNYMEFFGFDKDELIGREFFSILPPERQEAARHAFTRLTLDTPFKTEDHRVVGEDGKVYWQRWTDLAIFDQHGRLTGYQSVGFDITPLKNACEAIEAQHEGLETLFNESPIAMCIVDDFRIQRINPAFTRLFGFSEAEALGRRIPDLITPPDRAADDVDEIRRHLESGQPLVRERVRCRKDGSLVNVEVIITPSRLGPGKRDCFGFYLDITSRKKLEQNLRIHSFIAEKSPVVFFQGEADKGLPLKYLSKNIDLFGYEAEELMNNPIPLNSLVHPEDRPRINREVKKADRAEQLDRQHVYRLRTREGEYRWVSEKNRRVKSSDGEKMEVVGVLFDETERILAEQRLRESHRLLEESLENLQQGWVDTIRVLGKIVEFKDPYSQGHHYRVAHLAVAIAQNMGLSEEQIGEIQSAGLVHDIGKVYVPSDYLGRPGRITVKEFRLVKEHARVGAELLKNIHLPWDLSKIVLQHHERLDGSGYPNGLKGDQILLAARIIGVADVVEAMSSHRPWRAALGTEAALGEILTHSDIKYDSRVVAACINLFREKGFVLPEP